MRASYGRQLFRKGDTGVGRGRLCRFEIDGSRVRERRDSIDRRLDMKPWKWHSKSRTSRSVVVSVVTAAVVAMAGPAPAARTEPARRQLGWVLRQLNGAAADLTIAEIKRHVAPVALERLSARAYMALLKEGAAQAGGARISLVASMHSPWALVAVIETGNLGPAAIYINTQRRDAGLITALGISDVPAPSAEEIATPGPYTGPFQVSLRRHLYMTCMGEGSPTVILEAGGGGGAAAWREVQPGIAEVTRVCSYDRANVPGGASSFARRPRTARGAVRDCGRSKRSLPEMRSSGRRSPSGSSSTSRHLE
jgi:hypothetical protein